MDRSRDTVMGDIWWRVFRVQHYLAPSSLARLLAGLTGVLLLLPLGGARRSGAALLGGLGGLTGGGGAGNQRPSNDRLAVNTICRTRHLVLAPTAFTSLPAAPLRDGFRGIAGIGLVGLERHHHRHHVGVLVARRPLGAIELAVVSAAALVAASPAAVLAGLLAGPGAALVFAGLGVGPRGLAGGGVSLI